MRVKRDTQRHTNTTAVPGADQSGGRGRSPRHVQRKIATPRNSAPFSRWAGVMALVLVVIAVGWLGYRQFASPTVELTALPGPRGGSNQAVDVSTLVGARAPSFTLADAEGKSYTITPGQGRPLVLVSHMGIT